MDDPKQRQPNITKAYELLDQWQPKVQLEEGLIKTIKYFDSELKTMK
jgi:UDP-glucuronate decarboxylase